MTDRTIAAANKLGANKFTNPIPQEKPSLISSEGAIGKQFNPQGIIGQNGTAGHVRRTVDGPRNPSGTDKQ